MLLVRYAVERATCVSHHQPSDATITIYYTVVVVVFRLFKIVVRLQSTIMFAAFARFSG